MGLFESLLDFGGRPIAISWNFFLVAEKMAPKRGTVDPKNGFSRFLFFLKFEFRILRVSTPPSHPASAHTKFGSDPPSRLGCRALEPDRQTNKPGGD